MNNCLCFPYFLTDLDEMWYRRSYNSIKQLWVSWKLTQHKLYFTCGCKWIYICPFKIYCMWWVKFCMRVLHVMWLNICEVWKNQHREGCKWNCIYVCNMQLCGILKVNDVLVGVYALLWSTQFANLLIKWRSV